MSKPPPTPSARQPAASKARLWTTLVVVAVAGLAIYKWWFDVPAAPVTAATSSNPSAPATGAVKTADAPKGAPAPVHVATVETSDFPVNLSGLGTVQAFNSVVVKSRVDGQVEKIVREEGERVNAGDLLVKLDAAPFQAALEQAQAKLAQDQANLKSSQADLQRTQTLTKNGYATPQLLDQRMAAVGSLTAQLQVDNAAIDAAKVQLAYTDIKSPITGVTGLRLVDAGNIVHATDQTGVMTINQLQPISVLFTAPERSLPAIIAAKTAGELEVKARSSDGKTQLDVGDLKLFDNQIDQASGTIKLKATFPNAQQKLWPGMSVTTQLKVRTLKNVVVVPDGVVQRGPAGMYAYVVTAANTAELRPLKVGEIADNRSVIEAGLKPGERVVVSGHYKVQPGGKLSILADNAAQAAATPSSQSE